MSRDGAREAREMLGDTINEIVFDGARWHGAMTIVKESGGLRPAEEVASDNLTEVGNATGVSPLHASAEPGEVPISPRDSYLVEDADANPAPALDGREAAMAAVEESSGARKTGPQAVPGTPYAAPLVREGETEDAILEDAVDELQNYLRNGDRCEACSCVLPIHDSLCPFDIVARATLRTGAERGDEISEIQARGDTACNNAAHYLVEVARLRLALEELFPVSEGFTEAFDDLERMGLIVEVPADERFREEWDADTMYVWAWSVPLPTPSEEA